MNKQQLEREVVVRLFQTSNALQTFLDNILRNDQLTAKQFFIMIIIGTFDHDPTISEIATRFATSRQNVKQVLLKLKSSGYVEMYKDHSDSRITRTKLTQQSRQYWENRNKSDDKTMETLFSKIELSDMEVYLSSLLKTMEMIELLSKEGADSWKRQ